MATLSVQVPAITGTALTFTTPVGADKFLNDGKVFVVVENAGASPFDLTFDSPRTCDFGAAANAAHDMVVEVAAGATKTIGPFNPAQFNDNDGYVNITYETAADTRIAVVRFR
jgi:hypothetical protein